MSDELSKDFRVGAEPLVVDAVYSRLEVPNTPLISMTYKDIVDLFRLERRLNYKMADFEADKKAFSYDADMMPSRWDDYDPEKTQEILDTVSDLLTLVKDQVQDWPVYEEIAGKGQLLDPELDKDGVKINVSAFAKLCKRLEKSTPVQKSSKMHVHLFGSIAANIVQAKQEANIGVLSEVAFIVTIEDVIDLMLCKRHFEEILQDYEAYKQDERSGISDLGHYAADYDEVAKGWREDLDSINTILFQYSQLGVDCLAIAQSYDEGYFPVEARAQQEQNDCFLLVPRYIT